MQRPPTANPAVKAVCAPHVIERTVWHPHPPGGAQETQTCQVASWLEIRSVGEARPVGPPAKDVCSRSHSLPALAARESEFRAGAVRAATRFELLCVMTPFTFTTLPDAKSAWLPAMN
jgi:hypothetical protein